MVNIISINSDDKNIYIYFFAFHFPIDVASQFLLKLKTRFLLLHKLLSSAYSAPDVRMQFKAKKSESI